MIACYLGWCPIITVLLNLIYKIVKYFVLMQVCIKIQQSWIFINLFILRTDRICHIWHTISDLFKFIHHFDFFIYDADTSNIFYLRFKQHVKYFYKRCDTKTCVEEIASYRYGIFQEWYNLSFLANRNTVLSFLSHFRILFLYTSPDLFFRCTIDILLHLKWNLHKAFW